MMKSFDGAQCREIIQELCNIPFATTATRECACPSGDCIHIHIQLKQLLNIAPCGTAAMADDFVGRLGMILGHALLLPGCR